MPGSVRMRETLPPMSSHSSNDSLPPSYDGGEGRNKSNATCDIPNMNIYKMKRNSVEELVLLIINMISSELCQSSHISLQ
mmetsp:Transcript_47276/g.147809  ORF Transcript_47276/g.147809 Transcript_47276/m.147809 type:complete len:80 (-) Transcript_47276:28-267(-)